MKKYDVKLIYPGMCQSTYEIVADGYKYDANGLTIAFFNRRGEGYVNINVFPTSLTVIEKITEIER